MRDPRERVLDILDAVATIERHHSRDKAAFERDELLQVWFLRHLQIISEAARTLPKNVQALAPKAPWLEVVGMRNILLGLRVRVPEAAIAGLNGCCELRLFAFRD